MASNPQHKSEPVDAFTALQAVEGSAAITLDGGALTVPLTARRFSTGSIGLDWQGKLDGRDGRRYQLQVRAVVIGSKPQGASK